MGNVNTKLKILSLTTMLGLGMNNGRRNPEHHVEDLTQKERHRLIQSASQRHLKGMIVSMAEDDPEEVVRLAATPEDRMEGESADEYLTRSTLRRTAWHFVNNNQDLFEEWLEDTDE